MKGAFIKASIERGVSGWAVIVQSNGRPGKADVISDHFTESTVAAVHRLASGAGLTSKTLKAVARRVEKDERRTR